MNKLVENVPGDLDRKLVDMVFNGKMAITEALADDYNAASIYAGIAKSFILLCEPSFATISALHDITYVYRTIYVKTGNEQALKCLVNEGFAAVDTLEDMREEHRTLWKVLLFQFILLSLLNIGIDLRVDITRRLDQRYIKMAEDLIKAVGAVTEILPERRTMILNLARARFNEESDITVPLAYAEEALSSVNEYTFNENETNNIRSYVMHLKQTLKKKEAFSKFWPCLGFLILSFVFPVVCAVLIYQMW